MIQDSTRPTLQIYKYTHICIYMYVCMCVYVRVVHTHTYTHTSYVVYIVVKMRKRIFLRECIATAIDYSLIQAFSISPLSLSLFF